MLCYHFAMFRAFTLIISVAALSLVGIGQTAVQKIVDAEHAFAQRAAEVGTPPAFVEFMTDDAWAFVPEATKAKPFWSARKPTASLLSWAPNFADAAADGSFGYTTGNWEFRAKKGEEPGAFGDFNTIWLRQPDGGYKWLIDIGVGHPKPQKYSTEWKAAKSQTDPTKTIPPAKIPISQYEGIASTDIAKAYEKFASDGIRLFREDKMPIAGKNAVKRAVSGTLILGVTTTDRSSSDMAYVLRPYTLTSGTSVEKGNQLQVWKYEGGKWKIVLDVLKAVPAK
jgi:ketosteroid isomerase-like protein